MREQLMIFMTAGFLLTGCNSNGEEDTLKQYRVEDTKSCSNLAAMKQTDGKLVKDKGSAYCAITTDKNLDQAAAFAKKDYDAKRINEFLKLPYYHKELVERYITYDDGERTVQNIVAKVNIGLDQPYLTNVDIIKDTDDVALLVDKYHRLPDDYESKNLVKTPNTYVIGRGFSCQSGPQYLREEAANTFSGLVKAGREK